MYKLAVFTLHNFLLIVSGMSCTLTLPRSAPELAAKNSQHQGQHKEKDQGQSQGNNERDEEVLARRPNYTYKRKKRSSR